MKLSFARILIAASVVTLAAEARAQDARWEPWLRCWEMVRENVPSSPRRAAPRVCVTRAGHNAVTLTTTIEGQPALEQTIVSDGSETPIRDDSCSGSQRAEWSRTGERLFTRAELACEGQPSRSVSALSLIAPDGTWLDIRTVRMGPSETTRVSRYRRAAGESAASALIAGSRLTLEDVKEATAKVSPRAVEAALVETRASFNLTSRQLIDLDDAHVPANVIDLMVALSYPQHFVVERTARPEPSGYLASDPFLFSPFDVPFAFGTFYDDFDFPAYYYSPFAYSYLGRFDPRYFGPGIYGPVIVGDGGGGGSDSRGTGTGRVINGVGYTQVRPREAEPQETSSGNRGTITPSSADASSGGSSSGSSGGSVSSGGFSSGGSADDGGRTAQPR